MKFQNLFDTFFAFAMAKFGLFIFQHLATLCFMRDDFL
jgi:hypothetical protein